METTKKEELVAALNTALRSELNAVKMYAAHAHAIAGNEIVQGLYTILEVEEGHVRALAVRIRVLGGRLTAAESIAAPSDAGPTSDPVAIAGMLRSDLGDEQWAIKHYAATIADFLPHSDDETLAVLEENLIDELRHARWLRDQLRRLA